MTGFQPIEVSNPTGEYFSADFQVTPGSVHVQGGLVNVQSTLDSAGQNVAKSLLDKPSDPLSEVTENRIPDGRWILGFDKTRNFGNDALSVKEMQEKYERFPRLNSANKSLAPVAGIDTLATAAQVASEDQQSHQFFVSRPPVSSPSSASTASTGSSAQLNNHVPFGFFVHNDEAESIGMAANLGNDHYQNVHLNAQQLQHGAEWQYDMQNSAALGLQPYDLQYKKLRHSYAGQPSSVSSLLNEDLIRGSFPPPGAVDLASASQALNYGGLGRSLFRLPGDGMLPPRLGGLDLQTGHAHFSDPLSFHARAGQFYALGAMQRPLVSDPERIHKCSFQGCTKVFKRRSHLQAHLRLHSSEKSFKCTFPNCAQAFSRKDYLDKHERTHTGVRPFSCTHDGCGKAFSQANDLKRHMRVHSGVRPYACAVPGCNKSFSQSGHLRRHNITHQKKMTKSLGLDIPLTLRQS